MDVLIIGEDKEGQLSSFNQEYKPSFYWLSICILFNELASPLLNTLFDLMLIKTQCYKIQMFVVIFTEGPNSIDARKCQLCSPMLWCAVLCSSST